MGAGSTSVEPVAGAAKMNERAVGEVMVQGQQRYTVFKALEKRGWICGGWRWLIRRRGKGRGGQGRGGRWRLRLLVSVNARRRWCRTGISPAYHGERVKHTRHDV